MSCVSCWSMIVTVSLCLKVIVDNLPFHLRPAVYLMMCLSCGGAILCRPIVLTPSSPCDDTLSMYTRTHTVLLSMWYWRIVPFQKITLS